MGFEGLRICGSYKSTNFERKQSWNFCIWMPCAGCRRGAKGGEKVTQDLH